MKAVSLKIQIMMLVMLLVARLVTVFSWTVITIEKRMILSEVLRRVVLEGRNLALSSAKPLLFAPPGRGRDLKAGIAVLDRALALDPRLETALLLRAHARDGLGDRAGARADWEAALAINPECAPARRALEKAADRP